MNEHDGVDDTLIEHLDGEERLAVPSPSLGIGKSVLAGIAGDSATDPWASDGFISGSNPDLKET